MAIPLPSPSTDSPTESSTSRALGFSTSPRSPTSGVLGTSTPPGTLVHSTSPVALGSSTSPVALGTSSSPGALGTSTSPRALGIPTSPESLGTFTSPGTLGSSTSGALETSTSPRAMGTLTSPRALGSSDVTPSSSSASTVAVHVFKRPIGRALPPSLSSRSKRSRHFAKTVLDEDNYVAELESIIERDFYPGLPRLRVQNAYLHAQLVGDLETMECLREKYGRSASGSVRSNVTRSPSATPVVGVGEEGAEAETLDTPQLSMGAGEMSERCRDVSDVAVNHNEVALCGAALRTTSEAPSSALATNNTPSMSLDTYMQCHTSEDNESFAELMRNSEQERRIRQPWLFNTESDHNSKQKTLLSHAVPAIEEQAARACEPSGGPVATWPYRARNDLMYVPEGVPETASERIARASKCSRPSVGLASGDIDDNAKIIHANTRLSGSLLAQQRHDSASSREALAALAHISRQRRLHGKIGVDGREILASTRGGTASATTGSGRGTGSVDNELNRFVCTPSPKPGVGASPLMTWGEIDGTPFQLDPSTPLHVGNSTASENAVGNSLAATPSFRMSAVSRRERLAHELAERHAARHRDKKQRALEVASRQRRLQRSVSGTPGGSERVLQMLSPAARRLAALGVQQRNDSARWGSKGGCGGSRGSGSGFDMALRQSYTPTLGSERSSCSSVAGRSSAASTPASLHCATPPLTPGSERNLKTKTDIECQKSRAAHRKDAVSRTNRDQGAFAGDARCFPNRRSVSNLKSDSEAGSRPSAADFFD